MSGFTRPSSKGKEVHSHSLMDRRGQVQNVKAARVYVFGEGDLAEEDESNENVEFEMPEIRARRGAQTEPGRSRPPVPDEEVFYEREICDGETLQSLALKYACPMSELKRVNNLIKDQDFYALRVLKIPMRFHSYLSELVKQEQLEASKPKPHTLRNGATPTSDSDIPTDAVCSDVDFSDPETQIRVMRTVSIRDNFSQGREAERFLKKMDKDLSKLRQSKITERDSLDEVISVLTNKSFHPLQKRRQVNGADCGFRWWVIVLIAVGLAVLVLTVYFVYVKYYMHDHGPS